MPPIVVAALLVLLPGFAWAHHFMGSEVPRTFAEGLLSGLGHPIIGIDHAAFIVAAGFFLALFARGSWGIAALVAGSLLGAALHLGGTALPGGEVAMALSVILIGGLVIARREVPFDWVAGGIAIAGMLHGHAYAESIFGAEAAPLTGYLSGLSLVQLGLASGAFLFHRWLMQRGRETVVAPVLGSVVSAIGLAFLIPDVAAYSW
jgi:urease accessory protein